MDKRILVVDDNPDQLHGIRRLLETLDVDIECILDPHAALERIEEGALDLVISDVRMPTMSGLELLKQIRQLDSELPTVLITGVPDLNTWLKAHAELGLLRYFSKPFDYGELLQTVRVALMLPLG